MGEVIEDIKFQDLPDLKKVPDSNEEPNFIVLKFADAAVPVFKEDRRKDYVRYGENNLYPDYLTYLYNKSGKHNAIINGKAFYIFGKGYENGDQTVNRASDSLNDVAKKCILDAEIYGGWRVEVIWNKGGRIAEIYHVDFSCLRKSVGEGGYYYKENWNPLNRDEQKFIGDFDPTHPVGSQIFEYNEYRPGVRHYPLPGYIGSNNAIETDIEITKFHLSSMRNGMMPSKMIQFFQGDPPDEKKKQIERRFANKFTGTENAGRFIMVFNNANATKSVELNDLSDTNMDKAFIELKKSVDQDIFSGHGVTSPMLFGIKTEGQLGGTTELNTAYAIFKNTYAEPKASAFDKEINWLLSFSTFAGEYELQPTDPVGLQFDVKDVINSLPKLFVFKELGIPEDMWAGEPIGGGAPAGPFSESAGTNPLIVNDNIKNLTGRQYQGVMRIVRQHDAGKLTRQAAVAMLKKGFGLDDEDIIAFLGEEPQALAMSFQASMVTCPNCSHQFDYNSVSESGMGYVKCPKCGTAVSQASLFEANIIAMFDACGDSRNDFEILRSKKVSFTSDLEDDEIIFKQEAFKTYDVTATENKIIELIKKDPLITTTVIAGVIKETIPFVESKITSLIKRGYIETEIKKIGEDEIISRIIPKGLDITIPPVKAKVNPTQIYIKYSYEGPQDSRNRPFCAKMMSLNRLYSRADIEKISERLGYSVFDRRGGFWNTGTTILPHCRHDWKSNIVIKKGGTTP